MAAATPMAYKPKTPPPPPEPRRVTTFMGYTLSFRPKKEDHDG